mgnify:CR=1 FL=1
MTFGRSKPKALESSFSRYCVANGCPLPGAISNDGSRFYCACHHAAKPNTWPLVTERLRENEQIRLAIIEVCGISDADWWKGEWELMHRYFDDEPRLQPSLAERERKAWYDYRLRDTLMFRCGVISREPKPREVVNQRKQRQAFAPNASDFLEAA